MSTPPSHISNQRSTQATAGALLVLLIAYATVDFLIPIILSGLAPDAWNIAAPLTGVPVGQAWFLTIWAALGPFRVWVRWPLVLLVGFLLYFSFCLGMVVSSPSGYADNIFAGMAPTLLLIPLLFLFAQLPLWMRKTLGGWQIVLAGQADQHSATTARQFGLIHILGLTTYVAVALTLIRFAMQISPPSHPQAPDMNIMIWVWVFIWCTIACIYAAVWTLPATWACFAASEPALGCLVAAGVWFAVAVLATIIISVFSPGPSSGQVPFEVWGSVFLHFAGTAAVLMLSLHILRATGCEMIRISRPAKPATRRIPIAPFLPPRRPTSPFAPSDQPPTPSIPPDQPDT